MVWPRIGHRQLSSEGSRGRMSTMTHFHGCDVVLAGCYLGLRLGLTTKVPALGSAIKNKIFSKPRKPLCIGSRERKSFINE